MKTGTKESGLAELPQADASLLQPFGIAEDCLLGSGGEAQVYALADSRVLRLLKPGASLAKEQERANLLAEIASGAEHLPFLTPRVEEVLEVEGRIAVLEQRLPGEPLSTALRNAEGPGRQNLLIAYLEVAKDIASIAVTRDDFGDIAAPHPLRRTSYREYMKARLEHSRAAGGPLAGLVPSELGVMPDCSAPKLVHFDFFPANVMVEGGRVTAVIDFGSTAMIADPKLECWSAVAYLDPELSPEVTDDDRAVALDWLEQQGLAGDFAEARRWIAGYWCTAHDDPKVASWCRRVLG